MNSDELPPQGPVALITLDAHGTITEATDSFATLIGAATPPESLVSLVALLADDDAADLRTWCRAGRHPGIEAGQVLRGRRPDGLPLLLLAHGVPGAFATTTRGLIGDGPPEHRLLVQRAGGPVDWTGSPVSPSPPRAGPDHVLAHDVRGGVRTAKTFIGLHQRRLGAALAALEAAGIDVPAEVTGDTALATAERALGTVEHAVDDLVRYVRLADDPLAMGPVRLIDIVQAATARARTVLTSAGGRDGHHDLAGDIAVETQGCEDLSVVGDAELLTWVVAELLVNARKFGRRPSDPPEQPRVTVTARREGDWLDLRVIDHGRPVDPALADEAFALGRMLQPRGDRPGAGLGLSLCRRIVARHAGRIGFVTGIPPVPGPDDDAALGTTTVALQLPADSSLDRGPASRR